MSLEKKQALYDYVKEDATMVKIGVTAAYKTDSYDGNISEEIIVLADGRAVFMTPSEKDMVCDTFAQACTFTGATTESESLLAAWRDGYEVQS